MSDLLSMKFDNPVVVARVAESTGRNNYLDTSVVTSFNPTTPGRLSKLVPTKILNLNMAST